MARRTVRMEKDSKAQARTIGANLKHLRKQRFPGWGGQKKFADFLGLSANDLSVYEYGRSIPNELRLEEMAAALGLTPDELKSPLPGVEVTLPPPPGEDGDEGAAGGDAQAWRERARELEQMLFRLEGRMEAYEEREQKLNERIQQLQEANFILRNLLYVGDSEEAKARRDKVLERLGPSMSELVKLHEAF